MKVGGESFYYSKMAKWATDTRRKLEHEVNVSHNSTVYLLQGYKDTCTLDLTINNNIAFAVLDLLFKSNTRPGHITIINHYKVENLVRMLSLHP